MVTSRIGIEAAAEAIEPGSSLEPHVELLLVRGVHILVIDEAQFASVDQVDALARVVDDHGVDVHAFGLSSDFLLNVFPASARLIAIADWAHQLPLDLVVLVREERALQRSCRRWRSRSRRIPDRDR